MQFDARRFSVIAIALLLTHCAVSAPSEGEEDSDPGSASETKSAKIARQKKQDARSGLSAANSGERVKRTGDLAADARAYAVRVATRAGVKAPQFDDFATAVGEDGLSHVRLTQKHDGLPVWGADVVVHATESELTGLAGSIATNVDDLAAQGTGRSGTDYLIPDDALKMAKADRYGTAKITTTRDAVERIVWLDGAGNPRRALRAIFYNELQGSTKPGLWNYVYDLESHELLGSWNAIDTAVAQGSGPGGNPKYTHSWSDELDLEPSGDQYVATTTRLHTINMKTASTGGDPVTGPLATFGDAAINDAHGYAEITLNLLSVMGHDSIDDAGFRIVSRVHYGVQYENAFWNGSQMTYGDGKTYFHPLSGALDVVSHEIHHGFTSKHSNLAYSGEPGGLNEGFSDIAGKTAEFFYKANPSWDLGADIFKQDNAALRYMCTPSRDGSSIEHASNMTPSLDPHYSSGVPNKFFCRLSKRLSSGSPDGTATWAGVRRAAQAVYLANSRYWTSSTTFIQGCQGTVDAARALQFNDDEIAAIKTSWVDVGVYCDGLVPPPPPCDETLAAASGTLTSPNYPNNYTDGISKTWCIDAPEGMAATLRFTDFETESGYDFVSLGDKTGTIITKTSGSTAPAPISSSRIYVIFKTDSSVTKKGWSASWTSK